MLTMAYYAVAMLLAVALATTGDNGAVAHDQSPSIYKDAKVANFMAAERMDGKHRPVTLSFWSGPYGKLIEYDPGHGWGAISLQPIGSLADKSMLRVRGADGAIWTIKFSNGVLLLEDGGDRPRAFTWQYQGPVDGRGTACTQCVAEEGALRFVADEFMRKGP